MSARTVATEHQRTPPRQGLARSPAPPDRLLPGIYHGRKALADGGGDRDGLVKSSIRVLEVFEYFRQTSRPARAIEISRALDLPHSSLDKILKTLIETGYLVFDWKTKQYAPSYRLVRISRQLEESFFGGETFSRLLHDIRDTTGETAYVCVQNNCWIECAMQLPGNYATPTRHGEGMSFELFDSAPGYALLATKTDREVVELAQQVGRSASPPDLPALFDVIRIVRRDGYAIREGASFDGAVSVCAALRPRNQNMSVAVGFTGHNPGNDAGRNAAFGALLKDIVARHA